MSLPHSQADLQAKLVEVIASLPWDAAFQELLNMQIENEEYGLTAYAPFAHNHDGLTGPPALVLCTSATSPANPTLGMIKVETDTGFVGRCASTSPIVWAPLGGVDTLLADSSTAANQYVLTPSPAKTSYSTDDTFFFRARAGVTDRVGSVDTGRSATVTSHHAHHGPGRGHDR